MVNLSDIHRLSRIDWNFPRTGNASTSLHALHWFPGNFIPQIPAALIQILSKQGDLVLDPFAGSGTTGVEAIRLGRRAIMSDRLSASVLICHAKLALLRGALGRQRCRDLMVRLTFEHECRTDRGGTHHEGSDPELSIWFAPDTLAQLRYLWTLVEAASTPDERAVLTALFSDVLFDCASAGQAVTSTGKRRRHHWGWVADNVRPRLLVQHNAIAKFHHRLAQIDASGSGLCLLPLLSKSDSGMAACRASLATTLILQQDARRTSLPDEAVDLVATSPPYIGVIDYTHANRLLYKWMGWCVKSEREDEIGARFRRNRKNAVSEYIADMRLIRNELYRVLRPNAYCALVIGESKRFPGTLDQILADFCQCMRLVWGPVLRQPSRRRVSDAAAREPTEQIWVFQRS